MKGLLISFLAVLLAAAAWGQEEPQATTVPAKSPHKQQARKPPATPKADPEIKALRDALEAQQKEIKQLQEQLQTTQQQLSTLQSTATQAESTAKAAADNSQQSASALNEIQTAVADLRTGDAATANLVKRDERRLGNLESPLTMHYRGIGITPGGYISTVGLFRTHNMNSDSSTSFGSIPLSGSMNSKLSEFRFSARQSRISLRADGAYHGLKAMGYFEMDFLAVGQTSANETQSNGFSPRMRLGFLNVDMPGGWAVAAGQNWSLLQTSRKGLGPLTELLPLTIDNSYLVGFSNARQTSIRVVKKFGNHTWGAFAVENPQTVQSFQCAANVKGSAIATCPTIVSTQTSTAAAVGGPVVGFQNGSQTSATTPANFAQGSIPSTNLAPDIVAKIAFEPGLGHYEIKAVGKFFRDRIYPNFYASTTPSAQAVNAHNSNTESAGIGVGGVIPVVKNKVDVIFQALGGRGIGRYGPASGPDVTLRPDGSLVPILGYQSSFGIETHPSRKLDIYLYGGDEYYQRTTYTTTSPLFGGTAATGGATPIMIGYGIPYINDSQCNLELGTFSATTGTALPSCSSPNRNLWQVVPGFWYRIRSGRQGTLQFGASYSYVHRNLWSGLNGSNPLTPASVNPFGIENIVLTSFRYNLP
jgi:hypothetical protein